MDQQVLQDQLDLLDPLGLQALVVEQAQLVRQDLQVLAVALDLQVRLVLLVRQFLMDLEIHQGQLALMGTFIFRLVIMKSLGLRQVVLGLQGFL